MYTGEVRISQDDLGKFQMRTIHQRRGFVCRQLVFALIVFLMSCFALGFLAVTDAHALQIEMDKQSIADLAELLSNEEVESLRTEMERLSYPFYLVIIPDLEGNQIDDFGRTLFEQWALTGDDVLFVISLGDREVHMEIADESVFVAAIEQHPSLQTGNPYTRFIDQTFVPHASNGDFYNGIVTVVQQLEQLKSTVAKQPDVSKQPDVPKQPEPPQKVGTVPPPPQPQIEGSSSTNPFITILTALALIALAFTIWRRRFKFKKKWKQIKDEHRSTLASLHQIEQELTPIVKFSKGDSERALRSLHQQFYELLQATTEFVREIDAVSIPLFVASKHENKLAEVERTVAQHAESAQKLKEDVDVYKKIESEAVRNLAEYEREWNQLNARMTEHVSEHGYSIEQLVKLRDETKKLIEQGSQSIEFDPLRVNKILNGVPDQLKHLRQLFETHVQQANTFKQLPERIQSLQRFVEETIENEQLLLVEIDPFRILKRMNDKKIECAQPIQVGDVRRSETLLKQIDQWEQEVKDQLSRTIKARNWIGETLRSAMEEVSQYDDIFFYRLKDHLEAVKQAYTQNNWSEIPMAIEQIQEDQQMIVQQTPEVGHLAQIDVQKYFSGEKLLQHVMDKLQDMKRTSDMILNLKETLNRSFEEQMNKLKQLNETLTQCEQKIRKHKLPQAENWILQIVDEKRQLQQITDQANVGLRDVDSLKQQLQQATDSIEQFEQFLLSEIQLYLETVQERDYFRQTFNRVYSTSGAYISRRMYKRRYKEIIRQTDQLISQGNYESARQSLDSGNVLISQMQREYQQNLQRERELERLRMLREQNRLMREQSNMMRRRSSHRSGYSSGGRSSSGSSSSGSSGSRGGSSSFSGSRGGSSSFGSRSGGSRGGGSKW